jgi:predicted phage terminase large subunit-like protein
MKELNQLIELEDIVREEKKRFYSNNFYLFDKEVLGYDLFEEKPHKELCDFIQNNVDDRFKLLLMPRGSFKSCAVTQGYPLWRITQNPNLRILIDSETYDKSKSFLSSIKQHMEANEKFRDIFGVLDNQKSGDTWAKEPTIDVAGIGQTKVGMHYDIIICDDLHSEKNITSKEMIEGVIDHYKLLFSLLEPDGEMIVIGTRWDYSDLYSYIIDNEGDRFKTFIRKAIDDNGQLLMPNRLTKEFLDNIKKTQGTYHFSCQYLNEPVSDETAVFKKEDFQHYKPEDIDIPLNIFMSIDPAISVEKTADYSAIVVGGFDNSGNIYILDMFRERVESKDLMNQIFQMAEKWRPKMVGIETVAFQQVLIYNLNDEMRSRGVYLPVTGFKRDTSESKEMRIRALQPKYQSHNIYHPQKHAYLFDLEFELLRFPRGKTDDIIDAEADLLQIAYPRKNKVHKKYHKLPPRSKITGV